MDPETRVFQAADCKDLATKKTKERTGGWNCNSTHAL